MINKFSQFLVEEEKTVYFTFGRMNPPTIGHGKLLDVLAQKAGKSPYRVFVSQSQDKNKNPLQYKEKIKHVRKMFPKHARSVMANKKVKTAIDALVALHNEGFKNVVMVVGQDRVREFDILMNKYNGQDARHGFYNFNKINAISAGDRDPDAEGVEGMSASKQRQNAKDNDFTAFAQGLPKAMSNPDAKRLFNDVRKGMGLKEATEFKNHIQLAPVSDLREAYLRDNIFEEGEQVVMTKHGIVGKIKHLGTNYLIVESKGETWRCWLDDVSKVDPNFEPSWEVQDLPNDDFDGIIREALNEATTPYEWGTPEATKKAKSMTPGEKNEGNGLWYNIRKRREAGKPRLKPGDKNYPKTLKPEAKQDPDIKDRPGAQPAGYHTGLTKAQKIARDRQFKKQAKMDDDNPAAYKKAPGDHGAKTKLSKHTKRYRQMFGEQDGHVDMAKKRIDREKEMDKKKHDRMMDKARLRDVKKQNMKEYGGPPISRAEYLKQKPMKKGS